MEHRLGSRHAIDLSVYLRTWGSTVSAKGRLVDLSVSGAFVSTQLRCRPLLHVTLQIIPEGWSRRTGMVVEGQIVRLHDTGIGVEWDELQPELFSQLMLLQRPDEPLQARSKQWM